LIVCNGQLWLKETAMRINGRLLKILPRITAIVMAMLFGAGNLTLNSPDACGARPSEGETLIDRGADVNAHAATGITPLMVAARYSGNVAVVRLLLKKGATPNAEKGIEVRNDASALFFAVMVGDAQIAEALLDAGARLGDGMKLVGRGGEPSDVCNIRGQVSRG
jgi:ankyrin repeat protein